MLFLEPLRRSGRLCPLLCELPKPEGISPGVRAGLGTHSLRGPAGLGYVYQDGRRSLSLCPCPAEPSASSTSRFTGCEPRLGEETRLNLGHRLAINWGFVGVTYVPYSSLLGACVRSNRALGCAGGCLWGSACAHGSRHGEMLGASPPLPLCLGLDHGVRLRAWGEAKRSGSCMGPASPSPGSL